MRRRGLAAWAAVWAGVGAVFGGFLLAGCERPGPNPLSLAAALAVPGATTFPSSPREAAVTLDDERRPAVVVPTGAWHWRLRLPAGAPRLEAGFGAPAPSAGEARVRVTLQAGDTTEVVAFARQNSNRWAQFSADLAPYAGRDVTLTFETDPPRPLAWSPVAVVAAPRAPAPTAQPNVLFVVIDTVRADHLPAYGYDRATTPELDELVAGRGMVVEQAYSQAPWTLPSAVAYMTSRYPGEILGRDPAAYGIPPEVPALAESFAALGYQTAGFVANPIVREQNGFGRGFATYYAPEGVEALYLHADHLNSRALPWLAAHQRAPFFLYLHYIDPHDPYANPDLVNGKSPWFEDPGGIPGEFIHGVYTGKLPLEDPERDLRHLIALYDSEIRFADRYVGQLIRSLPPEVLAETLIVVTSDHGEEFLDHGGWKHGHTLYEEQIRVPLLLRWDGRIAPGTRFPGLVRLVDLAPTLVAAAGGTAPADWQGQNLLPALTGAAPAPRLAAFAQHLEFGPERAAAVLDGKKLIRYNAEEPFTPADGLQEHIYRVDHARLQPAELYDLGADPDERTNLLASARPEEGRRALLKPLEPVLMSHLDRTFGGLRALLDHVPAGAVLRGELTFERAPERAVPLFLTAADEVSLSGRTLRFRVIGELEEKGFRLVGDPGGLVSAALWLDDAPLPPERLRLGNGALFAGRAVAESALTAVRYPARGESPGLRLWRPSGQRPSEITSDPATREAMRALGYLQ